MGAGLLSGEVYNRRTDELYAADAGVEDAIWKIQHGETPLCAANRNWTYPSPSEPPMIVNGKSVQVTIEYQDDGTFKITSTAVSIDDSNTAAIVSSSGVEAYVSPSFMNFSSLLENAIVSNSTITIQPGNVVNGDVWLPDTDDLTNRGAINGTVKDSSSVTIVWPTYEQLSPYYLDDVGGAPDPGSYYDIAGQTNTEGPWYRNGGLVIDNTGDSATLVLGGTIYVTDDLLFQQAGSHEYTIDLNEHTIFVEGSIDFPSAHVSICGSGCIIATGNINFQPSISSEGDEFVLVMSISGEVEFHPSGDFTGCVAGNVDVQLQPGNTINWISPEGKGLDFPMGESHDPNELPPIADTRIESWEIKQQ